MTEMEDGSTAKTTKLEQKMAQFFKRMDDVEFFLRTGTYPESCDKQNKGSIRRSCRNFVLKGDVLWYRFRGRLRRALRKEEEVWEVLTQHHDNNDHAGQSKVHQAVTSLYYWGSIEPTIKKWVRDCATCRNRPFGTTGGPFFQRCIAYGCGSNSSRNTEGTTFYKFPRDHPERMDLWLAVAQRDKWSIQSNVYLCSKHFTDDCFESSEEGRFLRPDAVPTLVVPSVKEHLLPELEDEDEDLEMGTQDDLIVSCNDTLERTEHQYALLPPETNRKSFRKGRPDVPQTFVKEPCFVRYDALERYMITGTYSNNSKTAKSNMRRLAKGFVIQDGVLMNCQRPVLRRVLRNRKEVNVVLKRFHDDQGHYGLTSTYRAISKQYVWATLTRDLADWIANCDQCSVETESRKHQCSVYKCNNYSGPVERGLGITFHPFPIHSPLLLAGWLKSLGRASWFPRPRSVVCSGHFTEDCFDRSGGAAVLKADAVPSLFLYQLPQKEASQKEPPRAVIQLSQATTSDQAFFAKYDAVERYISKKIYPPGLTFVEKNTIRRFCKKFTIKDDLLHIVLKNRVRKVLRSREEVNEVLAEFHDELNHLDVKKCMRLLTERVFWGTMMADVARWIENCDQCSATKKARMEPKLVPEPTGKQVPPLMEPHQTAPALNSIDSPVTVMASEDDDDSSGNGDSDDEGGGVQQPATVASISRPVTTDSVQTVLHQCLYSQQQNKVVLVRASEPGLAKAVLQPQLHVLPSAQVQGAVPINMVLTVSSQPLQAKHQTRFQTRAQAQGRSSELATSSSGTGLVIQVSGNLKTPPASAPTPALGGEAGETSSKAPSPRSVLPSSKASSPQDATTAGCKRAGGLQARAVIQQCTQALLKIRPSMDGADAEWVEIQHGMVVYVCFFKGATEEIIPKMVETLLGTKLFRSSVGQNVSVLDLPGSILLVPQDTLTGTSVVRKRVVHHEVAERWWAAQLYGRLVEACESAVENTNKLSTDSGVQVKHGIYGNKQEILINSKEPFTLLLEF